METGSRMVNFQGLRKEGMESYLMGNKFHFCKMKRVMDMDGDDGFAV